MLSIFGVSIVLYFNKLNIANYTINGSRGTETRTQSNFDTEFDIL
jgi:hypothetical protein